jgi:cephalosporin hydroxylase
MENKEILKEAYSLGMMQDEYEINNAIDFIRSLNVKNFMEIGTDQGGTFVCWSRISDPNGLRISVDWAHGPWGINTFDIEARNSKLLSLGSDVHILDGDSHAEWMYQRVKSIIGDKKLDFLFIDGDHSHLGVKLDYHMYKEFVKPGGWIGFHDIKDTENHHSQGCYVDFFWNELNEEKIWFMSGTDRCGIGFIKNNI